jgi:TPR repeat protein
MPLSADGLSAVSALQRPMPQSVAGGRYRIVSLICESGCKRVCLARDRNLDRDVAITFIAIPHLGRAGRLHVLRLARVAARLSGHPHILTLYDAGEERELPYLVTEYVRGGSLGDLLAKSNNHRLALSDAVRIADQICGALEYAHSLGISHGNLKPSNVLLAFGESVKLGDFGFGLDFAANASRLTGATVPIDTVAYVAPEQARGAAPDFRSDLYSVGTILYELVTGRPPFVGNDVADVLTQHLNLQPGLPSWRVPDVPASLDELIRGLLQKSPQERPQSAAVVRAQLRAIDSERHEPLPVAAAPVAEPEPIQLTEEVRQPPAEAARESLAPAGPAWSTARLRTLIARRRFVYAAAAVLAVIVAASALEMRVSLRGSYRFALSKSHRAARLAHAIAQSDKHARVAAGDHARIAMNEPSEANSGPARPDGLARDGKAQPDADLLELAREGNPGAATTLATMYLRGEGVSKDPGEAARWFREAAARGDSDAQVGLGYMYASGTGVPQDLEQALRWFREAAARGDANAQYDLALMYEEGRGVARDRAEALRWLRRAASRDNARAQYELGEAYLAGTGVSRDYTRALQWFRKAAQKAEPRAENALGYMYEQGEGVSRNFTEALKWYRKAAQDGDAKAQLNLGIMYEKGENVVQDYTASFEWYRKAAERGDAYAQTSLGVMFCKGEGASRDYAKALEWFRKAAEQNEPKAEYNLGVMYDNAMGVAKDEVEAARWYRKAAEGGNSDAQYNLAYMYEHGQGVPRNYSEALKWYRKAAEHGDLDARDRLEALESR